MPASCSMYDFSVARLFRSPAGVSPPPCFSSARYYSARLNSNIARCVPASCSFLYCDGANTTPLALTPRPLRSAVHSFLLGSLLLCFLFLSARHPLRRALFRTRTAARASSSITTSPRQAAARGPSTFPRSGQDRCATVAPRTLGQDPTARARSTGPSKSASRIRNRAAKRGATCSTGRKAYTPPSESSRRKA